MAVLVTLDGLIHDPDAPLLHADDLAAVRGDGVFETLLVRDGAACLVEAHLQRLVQSARMTDLPEPDLPAWRRAITAAAAQWTATTAREGRRSRTAPGVHPRTRRRLRADGLCHRATAGRPGRGRPPRRGRRVGTGPGTARHRNRRDAVVVGGSQDVVVCGEHGRASARGPRTAPTTSCSSVRTATSWKAHAPRW